MNVTFFFLSLPIGSWTHQPHPFFGIPVIDVHNFQILALILLDQIWMARNLLINNDV